MCKLVQIDFVRSRRGVWSGTAGVSPCGVLPRKHSPQPSFSPAIASDARPRLNGLRVLAVEDHADSLDLLTLVLTRLGCSVLQATSARSALEILKDAKPGLIVSDIGLPDEDGYSLMQRVRSLASHDGGTTPAIALTAFTRPEDRRRALAAGFDVFLPKPLNVESLEFAVAALTSAGGPPKD